MCSTGWQLSCDRLLVCFVFFVVVVSFWLFLLQGLRFWKWARKSSDELSQEIYENCVLVRVIGHPAQIPYVPLSTILYFSLLLVNDVKSKAHFQAQHVSANQVRQSLLCLTFWQLSNIFPIDNKGMKHDSLPIKNETLTDVLCVKHIKGNTRRWKAAQEMLIFSEPLWNFKMFVSTLIWTLFVNVNTLSVRALCLNSEPEINHPKTLTELTV